MTTRTASTNMPTSHSESRIISRSPELVFFFSSRSRHTRSKRDWSSDVCSSDLPGLVAGELDLGLQGQDDQGADEQGGIAGGVIGEADGLGDDGDQRGLGDGQVEQGGPGQVAGASLLGAGFGVAGQAG